ncbi:glycosyltransferase family 2 protein [Tunicatimonas pelagia]|uniref:glycosyltransferase family 2 protein n=1 Tax=Tunicatimonas pelagia TaxID=931531 RepID=UPI002666E6A8|nr:glycosyltransferase [Tunicatimonas pelagia]WKN40704.1 glycosyltransferase [Tunicatimonas pelagia]
MTTQVAICIITYQRHKGLSDLLTGIDELKVPTGVCLQIIVVDNDRRGGAQKVVVKYQENFRFTLHYAIEGTPGIPFARNKALELTLNQFEYIAFIDDDEIPREDWLAELLQAQSKYRADAIMGPVFPLFVSDTPAWIERGKFFEQRPFTEGLVLSSGATSNALIRTAAINQYNLRFEESMAMTGGTDALFFHLLNRKGGRIVWADQAVVYEQIPQSRANSIWLLKRAYRFGSSLALQDLKAGRSTVTLGRRILKGIGYIALGTVKLVITFPLGKIYIVRALQSILRGVGNLIGLFNLGYQEYKTIHKV